MIEFIVLFKLTQFIGGIVEEKGRERTGYKLLTVLLWFGGEIAGAVLAVLLAGREENTLLVYGLALLGAALGGGLSYFIASRVSPLAPVNTLQGPLHPKERPDLP